MITEMNELILQWSALQARGKLHYGAGELHQGEIVMIQGSSGCGKSTLLRLLNGSLVPDVGEIHYKGENVRSLAPLPLRHDISLILQRTYLMAGSVEDNFKSFYEYRDLSAPSSQFMQRYLHLCCYTGELGTASTQLSGGEQQRVFLAIMLSFSAPIILLDEPTAALDHTTSHLLFQQLKDWVRESKTSLIFVSHDSSLACFADRIITIKSEV